MYRNCIFCSADLGANESIEQFPVGRSLAFDAARGRLWAVCPKCARWNLAPLEERWEAIEAGERLFRDARMRAQSENIGLARLRDGTHLIRVGEALERELAWWRYGEQLQRRHRRALLTGDVELRLVVAGAIAGIIAPAASVACWSSAMMYHGYQALVRRASGLRTVALVEAEVGGLLQRVRLRRKDAAGAWLTAPDDGEGIALNLPLAVKAPDHRGETRELPVVLRGRQAHGVMARALVHVNVSGAGERQITDALAAIRRAGSPDAYVVEIGQRRLGLNGANLRRPLPDPNPFVSLALEMALHEETERRAMEGELAILEGMWREAEEIAAIADRLPDLPAGDPPRVGGSRTS